MKTVRNIVLSMAVVLLLIVPSAWAQARHEIRIPNLPGYQTLKCDFHMHTVFSDGDVWPTVRVQEAWRQGLDVIAITDHIEYQPHRGDVPTKHNRPYELAIGSARQMNVLLPRATEITRDTPPGHFNAIFLDDVQPLDTKDFVAAITKGNEQNAFVFWNHQGWKGSEKGRWLDVHTKLFEAKHFHGMEVCNGGSYFPDAHKWCLEKNLTMLGNSDIHAPDLKVHSKPDDHRTMTFVFAKTRSLASVKEALFAGRTAVWYQEQVIGREEYLRPLLDACIQIDKPHLRTKDRIWVSVRNVSDLDVQLVRTSGPGPPEQTLAAGTTRVVWFRVPDPNAPVVLKYSVTNFLVGPEKPLTVEVVIPGP